MFLRFFVLTTLLTFAVYYFHIRINPEDTLTYQNLVEQSAAHHSKRTLEEKPAQQERKGVQKDIWTQDETRHFQIQSEASALTLRQIKEQTEVIEQLKNIQCSLPEDFILTADEGIYAYPSQQFTAQHNCRLTQEQNQIDGTRIHLDFEGESLSYENPKGYLSEGPFYFTAKELLWKKKEGKLYLTHHVTIDQPDQFTLLANEGVMTLDTFKPTLLTLSGEVRLLSSRIQGKNSYAIADTLTYDPKEKTLLFSAEKKVLFWQDGLSLSASEVLIRPDHTVEGRGDVHFTFNLEEKNSIDALMRQYL